MPRLERKSIGPLEKRYKNEFPTMESYLVESFKPIMFLTKILGMNRFSCRANNGSVTLHYSDAMYCVCMDLAQVAFYLMCTYVVLQMPGFFLRYTNMIQYWTLLLSVRYSEERMIKLANGVAAFDRRFATLPPAARLSTPGRRFWRLVVAAYAAYFACVYVYMQTAVVRALDATALLDSVFAAPRPCAFAVTVTLCFHLCNLGRRFAALDAFWRGTVAGRLLPPIASDRRRRQIAETAALVERVRLLHADLSGLLSDYNRAYGPATLALCSLAVFDVAFDCFALLFAEEVHLDPLPSVVFGVQNVTFVLSVLGFASWASEQKKKIILLLRCTKISDQPKEIQIQLIFFMDQILAFEMKETLAFGVLNYKMKLIIPIVVILIKVNSTIIQMENQPYFKQIISDLANKGPWNKI